MFCLSASLHLVVRVHHAIAGIVSFLAFNFWVKLCICVPRSDCWCAVRAITEPCKNRCLISFWCARPPHRTRLIADSIAASTSDVRGATASLRYLSWLLAVSAGHVRYNLLHSSSIRKSVAAYCSEDESKQVQSDRLWCDPSHVCTASEATSFGPFWHSGCMNMRLLVDKESRNNQFMLDCKDLPCLDTVLW